MSIAYREIAASAYILDSLWRKDQKSFIKFNVLDAIQIVAGDIVRWLFTSSDGYVKSKSKNGWNADSLAERCIGNNSDGQFRANVSESVALAEWNTITSRQDFDSLFIKEGNLNSKSAIISYGHTFGLISYFEITYEAVDGVSFPKCKTFSMCGSKAMGTLYQIANNSIPSEKIKCVNKTINTATQKFVADLVRIVESRRNVEVLKIVVVLVSENDDSSDMVNEKTLWMHHIKDLVITAKKPRSTINGDDSISQLDGGNSTWSHMKSHVSSEISHNTSSFQRKSKCTGDFCRYSDKEEIRYIESFGEVDSTAIIEGRRAVSRHRRASPEDTVSRHSPIDLETAPSFPVKDTDDESVSNRTDTFDSEFPAFSQSHYVPFKSIALARQDMTDLEAPDSNNSFVEKLWPQRLLHWWFRLGKTVIPKRIENMGQYSQDAFSRPPVETFAQTRSYVKDQSVIEGDDEDPSGFARDDESSVGNQTQFSSSAVSHIPYDLTVNAFEGKRRRNAGNINSYYSEAKVCERCYSVYRDIDYKRRLYKNRQFASQSDSSLDIHTLEERNKEIERKRFSQRRFASRMSTIQIKKDEGDRSENRYSTFQRSHPGSPNEVLYGGDSMAFNSVSSPSRNHPFISGSKNRAVAVSSQRGKLPPLGQLRDGEKVQTYEQVGSSFLRNMGNSQHYKTNSDHRRGSPVREDNSHGDTEHQWDQLTRGDARRIKSESDMLKEKRRMANVRKSKVFDPDKLLHQRHRELYSMRAAAASDSRENTAAGVRVIMSKKEQKLLNSKNVLSQSLSNQRYLPPLQQEQKKPEDLYNQYSQGNRTDVQYPNENRLSSSSAKSSVRDINSRQNNQSLQRKSVTFSEKSHIDLISNPSLSSYSRPYEEKKKYVDPNATDLHRADVDQGDNVLDTSFVRSGGNSVNVSDYLAGLYDRTNDDSGSDSDDNDGEEEGIGWSPFVIPVGN